MSSQRFLSRLQQVLRRHYEELGFRYGHYWEQSSDESREIKAVKSLLDETGRYLQCPGCNTLSQLEGYDPKAVAQGMTKEGMAHLKNCPLDEGDKP